MPLNNPSFRAGDTILPSRFVTMFPTGILTAADYTVFPSVATTSFILGVSQDGTKFPEATDGFGAGAQTIAAAVGDQIRVYGSGDVCLLEVNNAGSTITAGTLLTATTAGVGVVVATGAGIKFVGAVALETPPAIDGALIRVQVVQLEVSAA